MEEQEEFEIPVEFKKDILDIMTDNPDLVKIGDKEYRVHNMRMYAIGKILKLGLELCQDDPEKITDDKQMMFALCTDLDKGCEIIAIILCNHLFSPDNVNKNDIDSVYTYNDNLIRYMKAKILNSTFEKNQWAAIILGMFKSIDLGEVFTMLVLVKQYSVSLTRTRMKAEEQLRSWQEAKSEISAT